MNLIAVRSPTLKDKLKRMRRPKRVAVRAKRIVHPMTLYGSSSFSIEHLGGRQFTLSRRSFKTRL